MKHSSLFLLVAALSFSAVKAEEPKEKPTTAAPSVDVSLLIKACQNILIMKDMKITLAQVEHAKIQADLQSALLQNNKDELASILAGLLAEKKANGPKIQFPAKAAVMTYVKSVTQFLLTPTAATYRTLAQQIDPLLKSKVIESTIQSNAKLKKNLVPNNFFTTIVRNLQIAAHLERQKEMNQDEKLQSLKAMLSSILIQCQANRFTELAQALNTYATDLSNSQNLTKLIEVAHQTCTPNLEDEKVFPKLMQQTQMVTNLTIKHIMNEMQKEKKVTPQQN